MTNGKIIEGLGPILIIIDKYGHCLDVVLIEIEQSQIIINWGGRYTGGGLLTLILPGNLPHKFSNACSSGTESRIDLKPGCKFKFVFCLEIYK